MFQDWVGGDSGGVLILIGVHFFPSSNKKNIINPKLATFSTNPCRSPLCPKIDWSLSACDPCQSERVVH